MGINQNSIRIKQVDERDFEWMDHVDWRVEYDTVPLLNGTRVEEYDYIMKPSLDLLHFRELCKEKEERTRENYIFKKGGVEYTDVFICVNMNATKVNLISGEEAGRERIYISGIYVRYGPGYEETMKYLEYKRSGNAVKEGKHIFIREDFYYDMMKWSWLGYPPHDTKEALPYVEMKAYEALLNSTIRDVVKISPDEILLLDDVEHAFPADIARVAKEGEGFSVTKGMATVKNKIWDGECLLDASVFEECGQDAGMMLLRNFFFKSCAFRADIQGYYKSLYGEYYENRQTVDCFGNSIRVKQIKMIVTASSFKLFKFQEYFACRCFMGSDYNYDYEKQWLAETGKVFWEDAGDEVYRLWGEKVRENGNIFGIVKNEEPHKGKRNFTYQMINTMPFSEADIHRLMKADVKKLVKLRTDYDAYENYIADPWETGAGNDRALSFTNRFIIHLAKKNPIFRQTDLYKEKRNNDIRVAKQKLYEGKIKMKAEYLTLCSMPWELLRYSADRRHAMEPLLKKGEVYIEGVKDGEQVVLCRNPHTCPSNVIYATNRKVPELEKWFHLKRKDGYSNIVVISPWEWDVMEALNGADFDSDEVLCIWDETVLKRAKELAADKRIMEIPHADITDDSDPDSGQVKADDFIQQYRKDEKLKGNKIGVISNYAQILNSFYWDSFAEGSVFAGRREKLYDDLQILSVLIGVEIDKAKHNYSWEPEKAARKIVSKYRKILGRGGYFQPVFMNFIKKEKHSRADKQARNGEWLNCPMDYLARKLYYLYDEEPELKNLKQVPTVHLEDVFDVKGYAGYDGNRVDTVLNKLGSCIRKMKALNINKKNLQWEQQSVLKKDLLQETESLLKNSGVTLKDLKRILFILLEIDTADKMHRPKERAAFYQALLVNNRKTVEKVEETGADLFIKCQKESGKQINYTKCRKLFESFSDADESGRAAFGEKIKKDKNEANIAYMLQTINKADKYKNVKKDKLMALAMLYRQWPELFMKCVHNTKN